MTEAINTAAIRRTLEPHFYIVSEVWLRHPVSGLHLRVDLVALPRRPLLDAGFPFDVWGIEIKRSDLGMAQLTRSFKQCVDYGACIIDDDRAVACRGLNLAAVALYSGQMAARRHSADEGLLMRMLGKFNVGLLRPPASDAHWEQTSLEISDEKVWGSKEGVTGLGRKWPVTRRVGNGRHRAFEQVRAA